MYICMNIMICTHVIYMHMGFSVNITLAYTPYNFTIAIRQNKQLCDSLKLRSSSLNNSTHYSSKMSMHLKSILLVSSKLKVLI